MSKRVSSNTKLAMNGSPSTYPDYQEEKTPQLPERNPHKSAGNATSTQGPPRPEPKPRTLSQTSIASNMSSGVSRKPAPPVPQKPPLLSPQQQQQSSDQKTIVNRSTKETASSYQQQSMSGFRPPSKVSNPPSQIVPQQPRVSQPPNNSGYTAGGPSLPPRPQAPPRQASSMGLMDEDDRDGADNIPSLQPQSHR